MFDAKTYFDHALAHNTLPSVLLLVGPNGAPLAYTFALQLLRTTPARLNSNNHPDFHSLHPEGKSGLHTIDSLRHLIDQIFAAPFEAPRKVFLIHSAERMQPAAANALLKALEEPLLDATLILLARSTQEMLPTILSRCTPLALPGTTAFSTSTLQTIEQEIEALEDPVAKAETFDAFLASLLVRARDTQARSLGAVPLLPNAAPLATSLSLEELEALLQKVRLAYLRNIKLSACLDQLSSHIS